MSPESAPHDGGPFAGRRIVLGVTGGIAAYKAVEVSRRLVDGGGHVVPVMTTAAERFLGRTTLSALASEPVRTSLFEGDDVIPHTTLGQTADLIVVAPATARLIGAYANGVSSDLLTNILLATRAPVVIASAMHTEMWEHPAVIDNIAALERRGVNIVMPDVGRLAGGDVGAGRLADPAEIVEHARQVLVHGSVGSRLEGLRVVVTAGGTREPVDAVRVLANRSSGKQGHAMAAEAAARGASVTLITTADLPVPASATVERVETASQMQVAVDEHAKHADVVIMAAAVADFRPVDPAGGKLKKRDGVPQLTLEPTPDILAGLGAAKLPGQTLVGFAAETDNLVENAQTKLSAKGLDLIVANDVSADQVGFAHDTNAVTLVSEEGRATNVALATKRDIARAVLDAIAVIRDGSHDVTENTNR